MDILSGAISRVITRSDYSCPMKSRAPSAFCRGRTRLVSAMCAHAVPLVSLSSLYCRHHHLHLLLLCSSPLARTLKACNLSRTVDDGLTGVLSLVTLMAFSSLARNLGEGLNIQSIPACVF